jgi:hypothetical protein
VTRFSAISRPIASATLVRVTASSTY